MSDGIGLRKETQHRFDEIAKREMGIRFLREGDGNSQYPLIQ
jgi:hypothetical protein